jgi:hypothetical protein
MGEIGAGEPVPLLASPTAEQKLSNGIPIATQRETSAYLSKTARNQSLACGVEYDKKSYITDSYRRIWGSYLAHKKDRFGIIVKRSVPLSTFPLIWVNGRSATFMVDKDDTKIYFKCNTLA